MTTFSDAIERTRRRLMTSQREPINVLSTLITNTDTALTFSHQVRFTRGARLSVDLEDMYVVDVTGGGTGATVIRGIDGSIAEAHVAGAIVRVNPTWSHFEIGQAVNDEIVSLSSPMNGLFRIRSVDFDYIPSTAGYELVGPEEVGLSDFIDIWRVRYNTPGPEDDWPVIPRSLWRVDHAADTTEFPSGSQLVLYAGGFPGQKVRVSYKAAFAQLDGLADDVATGSGLHIEAHDILSVGAAIRLLSGYEAQRGYTTTQADPRSAEDVPPRTSVSALVPLVEQREERIREEQARLSRKFPEAL